MRYRKLDGDRDMVFGHGSADYWRDVAEAPAQAVMTRLQLRLGEWFMDTSAGTPWDTEVLGKYTTDTRDGVVRARVLGTQGVTSLQSYSSAFDPDTRTWSAIVELNTQYGAIAVSLPL